MSLCKRVLRFVANRYRWYMERQRYRRFPSLSREEVRTIQERKLWKVLRVAVDTVPFYRRLGIRLDTSASALDELKRFPIVTKEMMRSSPLDFI